MQQAHRFRIAIVAIVAALAASVPQPSAAMHAAGRSGGGKLLPVGQTAISLGAEVGWLGGTASELAYDYPYGDRTKLSELTWDLEEVAVAGVQASVGFGRRFRLNAGFWSALDEGSGGMIDRDWDETFVDYRVVPPDDGNWTDESRHPDTSLDSGTMFDVNLSVLAHESGGFVLDGVVGYKRDSWSWSSRGGTFVYSVEDFRDTSGDFEDLLGEGVPMIDYEQTYSIPYVGVSAAWAAPAFSFEGHALYSPVVSATDRDYHIQRGLVFEGEFSGGSYVGLGVNAVWRFATRWFAALALEYQSISEVVGDVTVTAAEGWGRYRDGGGAEMEATMVTLGAGYRF